MKRVLFILLFSSILFAEKPDTTLFKIEQNQYLISHASSLFDIDSITLSSIIYVERSLNFTWEDIAFDKLLAQNGLNSSIGFCQVKLKTAYWIEVQLNDSNSTYYPEKKYESLLTVSNSVEELINKLESDSLNIMFAAGYIKIISSYWDSKNCNITSRPDILGTLYSTGLYNRDGTERAPNKTPKSNHFGRKVKDAIIEFRRD